MLQVVGGQVVLPGVHLVYFSGHEDVQQHEEV